MLLCFLYWWSVLWHLLWSLWITGFCGHHMSPGFLCTSIMMHFSLWLTLSSAINLKYIVGMVNCGLVWSEKCADFGLFLEFLEWWDMKSAIVLIKNKSMLSRYNGLPANCLTNAFTLPVKQRFVTEGWCLIRVTYTSEYRIYTGLNNIILSTQGPFSSPATRLWTFTRPQLPCIRLLFLSITECRSTSQYSSWTVSKLCWREYFALFSSLDKWDSERNVFEICIRIC